MPGALNPVDIVSKHWAHSDIWYTLKPMLFWYGDTAELFLGKNEDGEKKDSPDNTCLESEKTETKVDNTVSPT